MKGRERPEKFMGENEGRVVILQTNKQTNK
jgi:hypothetical protein